MFVDFKQLAQSEISLFESKLSGYKLNNILDFLGIKQKIDVDHIKMAKDSRIRNFDMSPYIAYCIYDCVCLQLADQKHGLFNQQYDLVKLLKLPLFAIANLTNAKKIQINLLREYFRRGYSFHYSSIQYTESKPKYGALTQDVDASMQFKYLDSIASCDYASQYPNAILQLNIAPENISETPTQFAIDINYLKGEPNIVYFQDKVPVLAQLVQNFLTMKTTYK